MKKHFAIGKIKTFLRPNVNSEYNDHIDMSAPRHTYEVASEFGTHTTRTGLLRQFLAFAEPDMEATIDEFSEEHIKRVAAPHLRGKESHFKVIRVPATTT